MAKQYRPYLTLPQLHAINQALQTGASAIQNAGLIKYISRIIREAEDGTREANNVLAPSIEQKLGLEDIFPLPPFPSVRFSSADLYTQWRNNIPLTPTQISMALAYGYEHDLLTNEEESAYEKSMGRSV